MSCGSEEPAPAPPAKGAAPAIGERAAPARLEPPPAEARRSAADAASALRRYYDHVEAGRYEAAWAMRGRGREGVDDFARTFAAYERYRVTVGPASEPVEAEGWSFVEVPIQIFGRLRGGQPFGSAGSVTMRRASGAKDATAQQRGWHIYTG